MAEDEIEDLGLETPEDIAEVIVEEEVVTPTTTTTPKLSGSLEDQLVALVGVAGLETLKEVAKSAYKDLEDFVSIDIVDKALGSIEVFSGKNRSPHNLVALDTDGKAIDLSGVGMEDAPKGYQGYDVDSMFETTIFDSTWTAANIGAALQEVFRAKLTLGDWDEIKKQADNLRKPVQNAMTQLGEVFGFDSYEHLEMFFAAWLMKDSTCRLSGIPGTGKTTVIESAAVLLCNSYGYTTESRFVAPVQALTYSMEEMFGPKRTYVAHEYPAGQDYHLTYSNSDFAAIYNGWENWRFSDWSPPNGRNRSGSYLYDMAFLRPADGKKPLNIDNFHRLLNNCWVVQAPVQGFSDPSAGKATGQELLKMLEEDQIQTVVAPIQLMDEDGNMDTKLNRLTYTVEDARGTKYQFPMQLRYPEFNNNSETPNNKRYSWILAQGDAAEFMQKSLDGKKTFGLYTDAGRSEGYGFRQYLINTFQDLRCYNAQLPDDHKAKASWKPILEEMLREIGIAKIDYEKRADEVLYGIEIQQSTVHSKIRDAQISTYEFEPVPRPIVTQPIKFFNEANRSQAGVEDAVLGLIAERKVEYRGKSFDSPNFVAWMDTNPHQKGNDLAFIDRIDMELLFKSISLGERYTQLSGRYGSGKGLSPQEQIVSKLAQGGDIGFTALRFGQLATVWKFVQDKVGYTPPGQEAGTTTYDALREISYISVLFTQRYMPRNTQLKSGRENFTVQASQNYFESPLMDFSVTTNTNEEGTSNVRMPEGKDTYRTHTPFNIDRVLGFRFTNSLVKLSSALAFLRGKPYVTRQEILDGLPYVTAHRLGRAKSSKGEIVGLKTELNFNNEQEWIREAIVNGYLLQDTSIGFSQGQMPVMDIWEMYYRRCVDALKSAPALFYYERQVLKPLHQEMIKGGGVGEKMTPVHWHIATMCMQNEKSATPSSQTKPLRTYAHGDDYQANFNWYKNRVSIQPNENKSPTDQILYDYYVLRGDIASEPNLFSDDRETLLELLNSTMTIICGRASPKVTGVASPVAVAKSKLLAPKVDTTYKMIDTTAFNWRTYQDSIGGWGSMLQLDGTRGVQEEGFVSNQTTSKKKYAGAFADQALMVSGRMEVKEPSKRASLKGTSASSMQRDVMLGQLTKLEAAFSPDVSEGVVIINTADGLTQNITFGQFMRMVRSTITEYPARNEIMDGVFEAGGMTFDMQSQGLVACFPLNHTAGAPTSSDFGGEDNLRLWVRLFQSELSKKQGYTAGQKATPFVTLNMTMGITSNWATDKEFLNVVPITDDDKLAYITESYAAGDIQDSGNLSQIDLLNYQFQFSQAMKDETA